MSDAVSVSLIICVTILLAIWMIRSSILRLVNAKKESFTFAVRFLGSGMWLFRGDHRPSSEIYPEKKIQKAPDVPDNVNQPNNSS